jgi:hypothetical protein
MQKQTRRVNTAPKARRVLDADTVRLSNEQLEHLDLVGITVSDDGRIALAAAARARGVV